MNFDINRFFPDEHQDFGDSGRASFEEKRPLYLSAGKHFLNLYGEEIRAEHRGGASGELVVKSIASMTDTLISKLFRSVASDLNRVRRTKESIALVATGGYGRGELNPYSDIDLMFLYSGKSSSRVEDVANKILYFLWDMKLDVGYSVRTIDDCIEMANSDATVKTALLDTRLIAGNRALFNDLRKITLTRIMAKGSDAFIRQKAVELEQRREKYGSSVYLLEPNIKEGEGGLRDLHTALWVAKVKYKVFEPRELVIKGVLLEDDLNNYFRQLAYLWRMRNELHYFSGRRNDQLTFDAQSSLAAFFGYSDRGKMLAVEEFMRDYYIHATKVEQFWSLITAKCMQHEEPSGRLFGYFKRRNVGEGMYIARGELFVAGGEAINEDPSRLMKIFEYAQKHEVPLSMQTKELVRNNLHLINDKFRRGREVNQSFFNILRSRKGLPETLRMMHYLQFLIRFIPEFERVYCKVQHDLYHIYTVDIHSLFAVEELVKLWNGEYRDQLPLLTRIVGEIDKLEILILAVLFHDIGKGEGGGHSEKGAAMMPTIARRMGLSREESDLLEFLVRNHLLFAHIAQRRDLHDEKMILQIARQMGKSENVKMLYLLTFADIKAVGPDVWTEWKALLLQELFEKVFNALERGDFKLEVRGERVKKVKRNVLEILDADYPIALVKDELKSLSVRHLLSNPPEILAEHVRMLLSLSGNTFVSQVTHEPEKGYSRYSICTLDMHGLFSMITGVMAANGMNILGAQIHTSSNGKVLDVLQINSPQGFVVTDENRWKKLDEDMLLVLQGKVKVKSLVEKRQSPALLTERPKPRFPTVVEIDNEVSDDYTVLDIFTHDKVGLLYRITSTLTALGLYIGVSKISTKIDQVADVFYVRDIFGHKIVDAKKLDKIKSRLLKAIDEE
jgi:[protein-PII] uridylyltransferase